MKLSTCTGPTRLGGWTEDLLDCRQLISGRTCRTKSLKSPSLHPTVLYPLFKEPTQGDILYFFVYGGLVSTSLEYLQARHSLNLDSTLEGMTPISRTAAEVPGYLQ